MKPLNVLLYIPPTSKWASFQDRFLFWGTIISTLRKVAPVNVKCIVPSEMGGSPAWPRYFSRDEMGFYSRERINAVLTSKINIMYLNSKEYFIDKEEIIFAAREEMGCAEFHPDIVITAMASEYLPVMFPKAAVFRYEVGAFSRPPMPFLLQFDPVGYFDRSGLRSLIDLNLNIEMAARMEIIFYAASILFRNRIAQVDLGSSALNDISEMKNNCENIYLIAVPPTPDYVTRLVAGFDVSEKEFVERVAECVNANDGLIISRHPAAKNSDFNGLVELSNGTKLLSVAPTGGAPIGQALLAYCDGIITVNSSLGQQCALLEKRVIVPNKSSLFPFATDVIDFNSKTISPIFDLTDDVRRQRLGYALTAIQLPLSLWGAYPKYTHEFFTAFIGNAGDIAGLASLDNFSELAYGVLDYYNRLLSS